MLLVNKSGPEEHFTSTSTYFPITLAIPMCPQPGVSWLNSIWGPRSTIYIFLCSWVSRLVFSFWGLEIETFFLLSLGHRSSIQWLSSHPFLSQSLDCYFHWKKALKCQLGTHGRLSLFQTRIMYFLISDNHTRAGMIFKSSIKYLSEGKKQC